MRHKNITLFVMIVCFFYMSLNAASAKVLSPNSQETWYTQNHATATYMASGSPDFMGGIARAVREYTRNHFGGTAPYEQAFNNVQMEVVFD